MIKIDLARQILSRIMRLGSRQKEALKRAFLSRPEIIFILLGALLLRIVHLALSVGQIGVQAVANATPDSVLYMNMARDILAGTSNYEYGFFTFGPGYAYYLAINNAIFGQHQLPMIIVQILISSFSCVLIYRLADFITNSRAISAIAGALLALSYTSITLSMVLLSDTLYMFLFMASLALYLRGLGTGEWKYFLWCAAFVGIAILVRSIGQFWPIMMIIIAIPFLTEGRDLTSHLMARKRMIFRIGVSCLFAIAIMSIWILRNLNVYGIPTLAFTSAGGGANVAALTLERVEGRPSEKIKGEWNDEFLKSRNLKSLSQADAFRLNVMKTRETLFSHPLPMLKTYYSLVKENLTAICSYHRLLLPRYNSWAIPIEHRIIERGLNYINFWLSMAGFLILIFTRQYRAATILACIYFYYAAMIGFTRWQGSRLFYPGQIAALILVAIVVVNVSRIILRAIRHGKDVWKIESLIIS